MNNITTDITDSIPGLKIEANGDGTITLEQEWSGNVDRVAIHSVHVRYLAEMLGLIERPAPGADRCIGIAELKRENDRLRRQHLRLREHMLSLQIDFARHADHQHADLSAEMLRINAVVDLMDLVCSDFEDDYTAHEPSENPRVAQAEPSASGAVAAPLTRPFSGGFETPPELGVFDGAPADPASPQMTRSSGKGKNQRTASAPAQLALED